MSDFLCYWLPKTVRSEPDDEPQYFAGSNQFSALGLQKGDVLWAVTSHRRRKLALVAKIELAGPLVSKSRARRELGERAWKSAQTFAVGSRRGARSKQDIDITRVAAQLQFDTGRRLPAEFDGKHLQRVRRLTAHSAKLLERAWRSGAADGATGSEALRLFDLTSSKAVRKAIAEFNRLGRRRFLQHYGFGTALRFFVEDKGQRYDSKAIAAVAYGYQFRALGPLENNFSGGERTVWTVLTRMGFTVAGVEKARVPREALLPTSDPRLLAKRVRAIQRAAKRAGGLPAIPKGNHRPSRSSATVAVFKRLASVIAHVVARAGGRCDLCHAIPFSRTGGDVYLEVHHVVPLADDGPDTVDNAVALCANCHREVHHGVNRKARTAQLYRTIGALQKPKKT